ncbi:MAG TPA: hypothetical protein PKG90_14950 [Chitinophagaceae bacterium]|nr:hypothetical protein [Chitinophagaceae bacterium]
MAKRIYTIVGAVALMIMIYFIITPQTIASRPLVLIVTILYAIVIACIHGVLAHSLSVKQKGNLIFYPVFMGILFGIFSFIYIYVLLPLILPNFM